MFGSQMMIRRLGVLFVVVVLLSSTLVGVLAKALDNESAKHEFEIQTKICVLLPKLFSRLSWALFSREPRSNLTQMIYALNEFFSYSNAVALQRDQRWRFANVNIGYHEISEPIYHCLVKLQVKLLRHWLD